MKTCSFKFICIVVLFIGYFAYSICPRPRKNITLKPGQSLRTFTSPTNGRERRLITGPCNSLKIKINIGIKTGVFGFD